MALARAYETKTTAHKEQKKCNQMTIQNKSGDALKPFRLLLEWISIFARPFSVRVQFVFLYRQIFGATINVHTVRIGEQNIDKQSDFFFRLC